MNTLLLDPLTWDLLADSNGNIAMAARPYAIAQDVASAISTFASEIWFDNTQGLPYFNQILGEQPALSFVKAKVNDAAMSVPNVASANTSFISISKRTLTGQVQITDSAGNVISVGINTASAFFILDQSDLDFGILGSGEKVKKSGPSSSFFVLDQSTLDSGLLG